MFGHSLMIKHCSTVEERVRIQAYRAYTKIKSSTRRKKDRVKAQHATVTIYKDEVVQPQKLHEELAQLSNGLDDFR